MTWSAKPTREVITLPTGGFEQQFRFECAEDATRSFTQSFQFMTVDDLQRQVKNRIAAADAMPPSSPVGVPIDTSTKPAVTPPQPTADEQLARDFYMALQVRRAVEEEVRWGLIAPDDKSVTDAASALTALYTQNPSVCRAVLRARN